MSKLFEIAYLEGDDVNADGSLKSHVGNGKPVLVMVQGNFCGYCTRAKPDFQKLLNNGVFAVATVQTDGSGSDQVAASKLSKVNKSPGVPSFIGFDKDGKFVKSHNGGRDSQSLMNFGKSL